MGTAGWCPEKLFSCGRCIATASARQYLASSARGLVSSHRRSAQQDSPTEPKIATKQFHRRVRSVGLPSGHGAVQCGRRPDAFS
jgi:hypothetical protein